MNPRLPLYQDATCPTPNVHPGHAGLRYEKYGAFWKRQEGKPLEWSLKADKAPSPKLDWVTDVTGTGYATPQTNDLLAEHHERMCMLCPQQNALSLCFKTIERMVTGLGQDHPVENGFLWHPTLGVPYIPGSSIKGMLKSWLITWQGSGHLRCWFEKQLAGTQATGVGNLIFFDALPCEVPRLEADVITPHYAPYYQDQDHITPPADWHSPTPTPFLTVAKGQVFLFSVARRGSEIMPPDEKSAIEAALCHALATIGIGAKTAVGYGRFEQVTQAAEPVAQVQADPLEAFKVFCKRFGVPTSNNKGSQNQLVELLKNLSPADQALARLYVLDEFKPRKNDCVLTLQRFLFA